MKKTQIQYNMSPILNFMRKEKIDKKEFANLCDISITTLENMFLNKTNIPTAKLLKIIAVVGCSCDEILNFKH